MSARHLLVTTDLLSVDVYCRYAPSTLDAALSIRLRPDREKAA